MAGFAHSGALAVRAEVLPRATAFVVRTLTATYPVVELSTLKKRSFAIGCALSFWSLGCGLFGIGLSDAGLPRLRSTS